MKLVIHAGLHKTASSSFQRICREHRALLAQCGLHYPVDPNEPRHHSRLAWRSYGAATEDLQRFLVRAKSEAPRHCHTVLLSGEDFENALIDLGYAQRIEACAQNAGFERITWVFIHRPTDEYVRAIYQELANHHLVVARDVIEHAARTRGMFCVSTINYDYLLALDYQRFADRFKRTISGRMVDWSMAEFVSDFPGAVLLKALLSTEAFEHFADQSSVRKSVVCENQSPSLTSTRWVYLSNALGIFVGRPWFVLKSLSKLPRRAVNRCFRLLRDTPTHSEATSGSEGSIETPAVAVGLFSAPSEPPSSDRKLVSPNPPEQGTFGSDVCPKKTLPEKNL